MNEYKVDLAMCGPEFTGSVCVVAAYLTDHGYPAIAITDSYNGADNDEDVKLSVPEQVWLDALVFAEQSA